MKLSRAIVLMVAAALLVAGNLRADETPPTLPRADWQIPPHPRTFAEFLTAGHDLVILGTVREANEVRRGFSRAPWLMQYRVTELRLQIDQVVFGSATDGAIEMTVVDTGYDLKPGERVLAWGIYTPEDNWRLRGRILRVEGNELRSRPGVPAFTDAQGPRPTVSMFEIQTAMNGRHPSTVFNGTRAIALVKLRGSSRWSDTGAVFEVDSLGWVMGNGESVPRTVTFPLAPGCFPDLYPGDSLLVPLPPGFTGSILPLAHCPSALRIKNCFVPGLGVPLLELRRSIDSVGLMLQVRPMQRKREE